MKAVLLKIDESIFGETEKILAQINISRNRYINEALDHYNKLHYRQWLEIQLKKESRLVHKDSLKVLQEFENIRDGD